MSMVSRMVIHMVILRGGGPHMVKINHMVKIWKISSKNPNHYYLLNLHLQLLKSNLCCETTGGAAPGRRQRRDRPTSGAAAGQGTRRKKGIAPALPARPCPSAAHCGVAPQAGVLRCWALVCAWAGTGVPDGHAAGRADGCLCVCHDSPTPGSRESRWNSSRRCRLLCVASGWVSHCEAVGEMA